MNSQDIQQQVLQAVIKSLKTYPEVKAGDMIVLGKVNSAIEGLNLLNVQLLEQLSDYIELGYFVIDNEKLKVTELGITNLELNP